MASTEIELRGHIIDSLILPRVWGVIEDAGASFRVHEMHIGQSETEPSYARMEVAAGDEARLGELLGELQRLGAQVVGERNARTASVTQAGVLPDDFYSTRICRRRCGSAGSGWRWKISRWMWRW